MQARRIGLGILLILSLTPAVRAEHAATQGAYRARPVAGGPDSDELSRLLENEFRDKASPLQTGTGEVGRSVEAAIPLLVEIFRLIPGETAQKKADALRKMLESGDVSSAKMKLFLAHIPGKDADAKLDSLRNILGGSGTSTDQKLEIVTTILQAVSARAAMGEFHRGKLTLELREKYAPILRVLGGQDGYFNFADPLPIVKAVITPEEVNKQVEALISSSGVIKSPLLRRIALNLYKRNYKDCQKKVLALARVKAYQAVAPDLYLFLQAWGVEDGRDREDPRIEDPRRILTVDGLASLGSGDLDVRRKIALAVRTRKMPKLGDKLSERLFKGDLIRLSGLVAFPRGIPVSKIASYLESGDLPADLRILLRKSDGKLLVE